MKIKEEPEIICMTCGKKSKKLFTYSNFQYRVVNRKEEYRDFCSTKCLLKYYKLFLKQSLKDKEGEAR
jgi:endogenous inhibitor of DNA gyrase (YacG/DUF329 family)